MRYFYMIIIALTLATGFTARFEYDDYCYASTARQGIIPATVEQYYTWSGRYSTFTTIHTTLALPPQVSNGVFLIVTLALIAWGLWLNGLPVLPLVAVLILTRTNDELLFMGASIGSYTITMAFALFTYYCIVKNKHVLAWLMAFIAVGYSEITTIMFIVFLGMVVYRHRSKTALIALFGALVGFVIVSIAPGNDVRAGTLVARDLWGALGHSIVNLPTILGSISVSFAYMPVAMILGTGYGKKMNLWQPFLFLVATVFLTLFVHFYVTNQAPTGRILSVIPVACTMFFFALGTQRYRLIGFKQVSIMVLCIGVFFSSIRLVEGIRYAQRWDARSQAIQQGVPIVKTGSESNPLNAWMLGCMNDFYQKEIIMKDASP